MERKNPYIIWNFEDGGYDRIYARDIVSAMRAVDKMIEKYGWCRFWRMEGTRPVESYTIDLDNKGNLRFS